MQKVFLISMVVCIGFAASAAAGDLWINCEAGLEIYLDGKLQGVSEQAEFGKLLRGVPEGDHAIRIQKEGFTPKEFPISVGFAANQVVVGALSAEISEPPPEDSEQDSENHLVGMIAITSDPSECNVKFAEQRIPKIKPIMTFPNVQVGEHKLWFESSGTVLSATVNVLESRTAKVRVDFRNQRVAVAADTSNTGGEDASVEEEGEEGPRTAPECIEYWIEVLRTEDYDAIEPYHQTLKELGFPREHHKVVTIEEDSATPIYKLRVGPIERAKKAKWAAGLIRNAGIRTVWVLPEECGDSPEQKPRHTFRPVD